jgi:hypothetical protein
MFNHIPKFELTIWHHVLYYYLLSAWISYLQDIFLTATDKMLTCLKTLWPFLRLEAATSRRNTSLPLVDFLVLSALYSFFYLTFQSNSMLFDVDKQKIRSFKQIMGPDLKISMLCWQALIISSICSMEWQKWKILSEVREI